MAEGDSETAWRIQLARLGRGWTQKQVGEKAGKSEASITQMESGRGLSAEAVKQLADILGVSAGFLSMGLSQAADIPVIVEGARQAGWNEAVRRMRGALDDLQKKEVSPRGGRVPKSPGEAPGTAVHAVPRQSARRKRA